MNASMEIPEHLKNHKSIRQYKSTPIDDALLKELIYCGQRASSSGNLQSWSVVISKERESREKLYQLHSRQKMILQAPVVLTFCSDFYRIRRWLKMNDAKGSFDDLLGFLTGMADALIAAQNVAIAAESHGLGICYMGTTLWASDKISKHLNLPETVVPVTSLVVGYPDEDIPDVRNRLPLEAIIHEEAYDPKTDEEISELYREFEKQAWARYAQIPGMLDKLKAASITNVAHFYTSKLKYSKKRHETVSAMLLELLRSKKFM
jgi:nitroreductase